MNLEHTVAEHERIIRIADEKFKSLESKLEGLSEECSVLESRVKTVEKKEVLREQKKLRGEEIDTLKSKVADLEKKLSQPDPFTARPAREVCSSSGGAVTAV